MRECDLGAFFRRDIESLSSEPQEPCMDLDSWRRTSIPAEQYLERERILMRTFLLSTDRLKLQQRVGVKSCSWDKGDYFKGLALLFTKKLNDYMVLY